MSPRKPKRDGEEVICPKCGNMSKQLVECSDCGQMGCEELCNVLGPGKPCLDCEQGQTA